MKVGIIREGKVPEDKRAPFTPKQCRVILDKYPEIEFFVQSSKIRCYTDEEYMNFLANFDFKQHTELYNKITVAQVLQQVAKFIH